MFGITSPKLPISSEQRLWIDESFKRLAGLLDASRLLEARILLPTPEYFPDSYDGSDTALDLMFRRVAIAMQIDPDAVDVMIFGLDHHIAEGLPYNSRSDNDAGGLYYHDPDKRAVIAINQKHLKDPTAAVAVLAHEIGHVILLRPGLVDRNDPQMEPLNDLLTVFLGLGIFTANSAFRFHQFSSFETQGWSVRRLGYLSEEAFGYALARFAFERGDSKPDWMKYLSTNVRSYMKQSSKWMAFHREQRLFS